MKKETREKVLKTADPEVYETLKRENERQENSLILIASENYVSPAVLEASGCTMTNKYAEGYPGARYYGGNKYVDELENYCRARALKLFRCSPKHWHVNVQPYSGSPANLAVYLALGIVAMLVNQLRLMLLARDLIERKLITVRDAHGGNFEFVKAFERLPETATAHFPKTKEGKLPNAWRLYRCAVAAKNFSVAELIRAMDLLLEANRQLVSTQLDDRLVIEQAIAKIARE